MRDGWKGLAAFALAVAALAALGSLAGCSGGAPGEPSAPAVYDGHAEGVVRYEDACCPVCGEPAVADAESMVCANPGCPACGWPHGAGDSAADVLRQLGYEFTEG